VKFAERVRAIDRFQRSTWFKVVASIVVAAAAVGGLLYYIVTIDPPTITLSADAPPPPADGAEPPPVDPEVQSDLERTQRLLDDVLAQRKSTGSVAVGAAALAGIFILIIWLGVALSYIALALGALVAWGVAIVLAWLISFAGLPYPERFLSPSGGLPRLLAGIAILGCGFTALMAGLRMLFSALPGPIPAIARNVLAEAVRMKISLVFIVLLIFGLACLPGLLDPTTPLRYRVQNFLQYSTGGSFWIIAILTLLFSAATLSFEQRDRVIWQTMTKPVASWQYILGKWLGVVSLAAILLAVCGSAVFLFTEYLKTQPAQGESAPYEAADGTILTEDRRILQFQVLQASVTTEPVPSFEPDDPEFMKVVDEYVRNQMKISPDFQGTLPEVEKVHEDLYKQSQQIYRSIDPGNSQVFRFQGLQKARDGDIPLVLRYRIDSGSNMPDQIYRLTFIIGGQPIIRPCGLGQLHLIDSISPSVIDAEGNLDIQVINGDAYSREPNPLTISFAPGGLKVSYSVGGYQFNFFRVVCILWIKLAFLAMLAVWASTFLSFPVACLVAFGCFLSAEGSVYLGEAARYYASGANTGLSKAFDVVIQDIALLISWIFSTYGELRPTAKLVEGQLLSWGSVAGATLLLGLWCLALYGAAVQTFRKRELAMYSGN
jgi:hypothetical protein